MNRRGVTLVELLVALGVLSIMVTVGGDILASIIRAQRKAQVLSRIQQNGNYVLSLMEQEVRSATDIIDPDPATINYGETSPGQDRLTILLPDGRRKTYSFSPGSYTGTCQNGRVMVAYGTATPSAITDEDPDDGVDVRSLSFLVANPGAGVPLAVQIHLNLTQSCAGPVTASQNLSTQVMVRSFYE